MSVATADETLQLTTIRNMAFHWRRHRFKTAISLLLLLVYLSYSTISNVTTKSRLLRPEQDEIRSSDELILIVPATHADPNLCRALLSAAILSYPAPHLVNFGQSVNGVEVPATGGTHLAKISGVLSALKSMASDADDKIVMMVDGFDTVFQLGPSVLLARYHDINQRAVERASLGMCGRASCGNTSQWSHIRPQIVFASQKKCWPGEADSITCLAPPSSPLPTDLFGLETDHIWPDLNYASIRMRPRFLNSGFSIGPVGQMKRLFQEAERRLQRGQYNGSDQAVFAEIFGQQEYGRHLLTAAHVRDSSVFRKIWWSVGMNQAQTIHDGISALSTASKLPQVSPTDVDAIRQLEFGISLDYFSELSHTTVFAHQDADWIIHDRLREPSQYWHIIPPRPSKLEIPQDMLDSGSAHNVTDWSGLQLYTNLFTGIVPSTIHFNAWQDGLKSLRWTTWSHMWFHDRSKSFTNIAGRVDDKDANEQAEAGTDAESANQSLTENKAITLDSGISVSLNQLCQAHYPAFDMQVGWKYNQRFPIPKEIIEAAEKD